MLDRIATWPIERAYHTPYFHLFNADGSTYMHRYWLVPYGFAPQAVATNIVNKIANFAPAFNWDGGYPGVSIPGTKDPNYLTWGMVSVSPHSLTPGRVQQFNAGGQIQLSNRTLLSLNYLGTRGDRLHDGELENNSPPNNTYLNLINSAHFWDLISDSTSAAAAGVPFPYAGFSGYAWQTITPFPQVTNTFAAVFWSLRRSKFALVWTVYFRVQPAGVSNLLRRSVYALWSVYGMTCPRGFPFLVVFVTRHSMTIGSKGISSCATRSLILSGAHCGAADRAEAPEAVTNCVAPMS